MAKTNIQGAPIKMAKRQKKVIKKKNTKNVAKKPRSVQANRAENNQTNNESVIDLMTKHPELNQTFEYILYSNKYKHTLTDVFNIIKMLMSKLEELQNHDVDIKNIYETVNLNYKIKGLVQSTAINLSHVVEQLNVNESTFLNFANKCLPPRGTNDNETIPENVVSSFSSPHIMTKSEEPEVSNSPSCSYNLPNTPSKVKTEHLITDRPNTPTFDCKYTIVLSSDDEGEESNYHDNLNQNSSAYKTEKNDDDVESYILGSDFKDILSDNESNSPIVIVPPKHNRNNNISKLSSRSVAPPKKVKNYKEQLSEEDINEARKSDFRLRKRLNERNTAMLKIVKEFNLHSNDIVLEYNIVDKKPLLTIHKELVKILKKHQVEGIRFLWNIVFETVDRANTTEGTGCILAHRMGIGKTLQIITLLFTLMCHSQIKMKTFLIICPPGLIYNWMDEIYKWLKDIDKDEVVKVYDLPKTNKLYNVTNIATWKLKGGILIISYENFKSLVNCNQLDLCESFSHALVNPGPDVVILDEGHYIKNTNTKLLKSLSQIRTKRRIVLTGTPIQNSLKDYYTLVNFVKPNILGNTKEFSSTFIKPIDSGQFIDSSDEAVEIMKQRTFVLHKLLQNTVHRVDETNLKRLFTDKIEYTIELNLTDFQCELYEKFLNFNKTPNDRCNVFLRLHVLTLITLHPLTLYRLLHFRNGKQPEFGTKAFDNKFAKDLAWIAEYGEDPRFFDAKQSSKIAYVLSTIQECQKRKEKVVCFLKSPLALDALEYFLQKEKNWIIGEDYLRMDGKTPMTVRNQMCEAFNSPENPSKLFILSMGTGVLGYNMVGANRVILLSTSWNPSSDLQAIYRCLRFGQNKTVYVNRLLAKGTVEPKAYYRQISKLGVASSVVDLQHMNRKISFDQIHDLFTFDSSKTYYTSTSNTKDPVINHLIRHNNRYISDLKEHDSMLVESVEDQLTFEERRAIWLSFKNKQLEDKCLIKLKPPPLLRNTEHAINDSTRVTNVDIKQELNTDDFPSSSNSYQFNEQQTSTPNRNEHLNSSRYNAHGNNSFQSSKGPRITGTHTIFPSSSAAKTPKNFNTEPKDSPSHEKRNRWNTDDTSIHNQFRSFQNQSFNNYKRYPTPLNNYHHSPRGINSRNAPNKNYQSPYRQNNQTWFPSNPNQPNQPNNSFNPCENNFKNRTGMFK